MNQGLSPAPRIDFESVLFAKFYEGGDYYRAHVDQSPAGLTFLYQFQLHPGKNTPGDLVFSDGARVPFEHNQLLIFHSFRLHQFDQGNESQGKAILQLLPGLLP